MRPSSLALPLESPFRPDRLARRLDPEDLTLSLVELDPEDENDDTVIDLDCTLQFPRMRSEVVTRRADDALASVDVSLDELSIIEDEQGDEMGSCARLSLGRPALDHAAEAPWDSKLDPNDGLAGDFWIDVSELDERCDASAAPAPIAPLGAPNPFLVEESSTFSAETLQESELNDWLQTIETSKEELDAIHNLRESSEIVVGHAPATADDMLDPATVDIDSLIEEELGEGCELASPRHDPSHPLENTSTHVLRHSWTELPSSNTNATRPDLSLLDIERLERIVRKRVPTFRPVVWRAPTSSLPRFPLLPAEPQPTRAPPPAVAGVPALRLPRFEVA